MKEKKITLSSQIELLLFIKMRFCFRNEIISDGLLGSRRREGCADFWDSIFLFLLPLPPLF